MRCSPTPSLIMGRSGVGFVARPRAILFSSRTLHHSNNKAPSQSDRSTQEAFRPEPVLSAPWLLLMSLSRLRFTARLSFALCSLSSRMCASATLRIANTRLAIATLTDKLQRCQANMHHQFITGTPGTAASGHHQRRESRKPHQPQSRVAHVHLSTRSATIRSSASMLAVLSECASAFQVAVGMAGSSSGASSSLPCSGTQSRLLDALTVAVLARHAAVRQHWLRQRDSGAPATARL